MLYDWEDVRELFFWITYLSWISKHVISHITISLAVFEWANLFSSSNRFVFYWSQWLDKSAKSYPVETD